MITLMSSDGHKFDVEEAVVMQSRTIKDLVEKDNHALEPILLQNVTSVTLEKVIKYCEKHVVAKEELDAWDADFVKEDSISITSLANVRFFSFLNFLPCPRI